MTIGPIEFKSNHTQKIDSWNGCIINGTLIMLADGSQKKIEDVLPTDKLLSFNHKTGMESIKRSL